MSGRSGYIEDWDGRANLYRGTVARALDGKRGQKFLRELVAALDALPEHRLITGALVSKDGECCAIGAVFCARGLSVAGLDIEDPEEVAARVGIARSMAAEIEYENDDCGRRDETPERRWERMRAWASSRIVAPEPTGAEACGRCEHPLREHPPDSPCCAACSGWEPKP